MIHIDSYAQFRRADNKNHQQSRKGDAEHDVRVKSAWLFYYGL
jgi:hypothetical protein